VLTLVQGAVQAGYSLLQALDLAVSEVPAPASEEFGRVLREIRLGLSLEGALFNLAERMENDDLQIVVTAIIINAQVGGNLSTVLEAVIHHPRPPAADGRDPLADRLRPLCRRPADAAALPVGRAIFAINPTTLTRFHLILTQILFGVALLGILIGNIWIRRIVRIKV
jgi:tight adherence protein B